MFIGAGDIARCGDELKNAKATGRLIQSLIERFPNQTTVFTAGDNAYERARRMNSKSPQKNSAFRDDKPQGILALKLSPGSYTWAFLGIDGNVYDQSDVPVKCHNPVVAHTAPEEDHGLP